MMSAMLSLIQIAALLLLHQAAAFSSGSSHGKVNLLPFTRFTILRGERSPTSQLFAYDSASSASASVQRERPQAESNIAFQKVVRPPPNLPDVLFLGYLIEYLEKHYQLPPRLPMTYESLTVDNEKDMCTLIWDSPLSPSSDATRMKVEVVGIYTAPAKDEKQEKDGNNQPASTLPNMAMIIVRKEPETQSTIPPMMINLFQDSEQKILKSLDRGLEDFMAGKILFDNEDNAAAERRAAKEQNLRDAEQVVLADYVDDDDLIINRELQTKETWREQNSKIIDAVIDTEKKDEDEGDDCDGDGDKDIQVSDPSTKTSDPAPRRSSAPSPADFAVQQARKVAELKQEEARKQKLKLKEAQTTSEGGEFAVEAAKKAATLKQQQADTKAGGFAVAAAKKMALQRTKMKTPKPKVLRKKKLRRKKKTTVKVRGEDDDDDDDDSDNEGPSPEMIRNWRPKKSTPAAFKTTISRPNDYASQPNRRLNQQQQPQQQPQQPEQTQAQSLSQSQSQPTPKPQRPAQKTVRGTSELSKEPITVDDGERSNGNSNSNSRIIDATIEATTTMNAEAETNESNKEETEQRAATQQAVQLDKLKRRKLNVKVLDGSGASENPEDLPLSDPTEDVMKALDGADERPSDNGKGKNKAAPSQQQIEKEIMEASKAAMEEIADNTEAMTAEELLEDILKFDKKISKENEAGAGFASGAFEKAKELLREQNKKRQARLQKKVLEDVTTEFVTGRDTTAPTSSSSAATAASPQAIPQPAVSDGTDGRADDATAPTAAAPAGFKEMTADEELRAMFEAGQSLAEGRITETFNNKGQSGFGDSMSSAISGETGGTTAADIDALIAAEKDISSYARVLDDDLAELEVRVNRSPEEDWDAPGQNPVFDIMSGPEVYNPNVDPETVNYPGAIPGTKKIRLPKQLDESVKQASFAADVLQKMKTVEGTNDEGETVYTYFIGEKEITAAQVESMLRVVSDATQIGLIDDPLNYLSEKSRLQMVLDEMWDQPEERHREISSNYKELLLSENFVKLVNERMTEMADRDLDALRRDDDSLDADHAKERRLLGHLVVSAQLLLKEVKALGSELEAQQLEIVRSICQVAMDPSHQTEEEAAMALTDAVRDMRPMLDDVFIAYLKYAVAEEEARLARAGLLDDPEHNQWLFVLKIVQQGVYKEVSRSINRYIDHITYVLRMETPKQRRELLSQLIDDMPTLDVRPFVQVVDNIAGSLGDAARGEFDGLLEIGEITNKVLQLKRDVNELLPPDRIALKSRDADEWAAQQKEKLLERRKISEQRLNADKDFLQGREHEIEEFQRRGEMERFD